MPLEIAHLTRLKLLENLLKLKNIQGAIWCDVITTQSRQISV